MFDNHRCGADMDTFILRLPMVKAKTGLGRSSIYKGIKAGTFPSPVALGPRAVGWVASSVNDWIASRPRAGATKKAIIAPRGVMK